jgi:glycerol-3-phosphate acyltransferase PlsX
MKIAVDAMGGDLGLQITVPGAVQASREHNLDVVLVGIEDRIRAEIIRLGGDQTRLTIVNATESVGMGDGVFAIRRMKRSSIRSRTAGPTPSFRWGIRRPWFISPA